MVCKCGLWGSTVKWAGVGSGEGLESNRAETFDRRDNLTLGTDNYHQIQRLPRRPAPACWIQPSPLVWRDLSKWTDWKVAQLAFVVVAVGLGHLSRQYEASCPIFSEISAVYVSSPNNACQTFLHVHNQWNFDDIDILGTKQGIHRMLWYIQQHYIISTLLTSAS